MNLNIVYEDEWLLILNKPAGIAIHPSCQHFDNSLSNGLSYYFNQIGLKKKIRPINRLDFHTSGLCVFAKCEYIQEMLSKEMISHDFVKEYTCIVEGFLSSKEGQLSFPIARKPSSIIEREVPADGHGQMSITNYRDLKEFKDRFKEDFLTKYADEYKKLYKLGLLRKDKDHIHVTEKGYLLLDRILLSLFPSR